MSNHVKEVEITCQELTEIYRQYKERTLGPVWFCDVIIRTFGEGMYFPESHEVIQQFTDVVPNRFIKGRTSSCIITQRMLRKYAEVKDPRLSLLKAIPEDHVFTFKLY